MKLGELMRARDVGLDVVAVLALACFSFLDSAKQCGGGGGGAQWSPSLCVLAEAYLRCLPTCCSRGSFGAYFRMCPSSSTLKHPGQPAFGIICAVRSMCLFLAFGYLCAGRGAWGLGASSRPVL